MVYNYYYSLSKRQQSIYQKSDRIQGVHLKQAATGQRNNLISLEKALNAEDKLKVNSCSKKIIDSLVEDIQVPAINIKVLSVRPSNNSGELHGLYEPAEGRKKARISVWMRTAKHKRVVAFRSFLRTLLHEFCHHLDYELFHLQESYHTEGFFKRESSLFKQLMQISDPTN